MINVDQIRLSTWLTGEQPLPARREAELDWVIDRRRREIALQSVDAPRCEWMESWSPTDADASVTEVWQRTREFRDHPSKCPFCQGRLEYLEKRFGPQSPYPSRNLASRLAPSVFDIADTVPSWLVPPLVGAGVLVVMVAIPLTFLLIRSVASDPTQAVAHVLAALGQLAIVAVLGASGGMTYSMTRPFTRQLGVAGEYLSGMAGAFGYLLAMVIVLPYFDEATLSLLEPSTWIFLIVGAVVFGAAVTYGWRSAPW